MEDAEVTCSEPFRIPLHRWTKRSLSNMLRPYSNDEDGVSSDFGHETEEVKCSASTSL